MSERMLLTNMPVSGTEVLVCAILDESGHLQDFFLYPPSDPAPQPGEIYAGKIDRLHRQTDGAFVRLGKNQIAYLPLRGRNDCKAYVMKTRRQEGALLREGDELLVQVDVSAQKSKLPRVDGELNLPGRYLAITTRDPGWHFSKKLSRETQQRIRADLAGFPGDSFGMIVRTNAAEASAELLQGDYHALRNRMRRILEEGTAVQTGTCLYRPAAEWLHLLDRITFEKTTVIETDRPELLDVLREALEEFDNRPSCLLYQNPDLPLYQMYRLPRKLEQLTTKRVYLKSGGSLVIEPTEAFVSVDVNSGKFSGKRSREEMAYQVNLEAARELLRQLRLRQLSGTILVDFINMEDGAARQALMKQLGEMAAADPVKTIAVDMTALGIAELTREKRYPSLLEQLHKLRRH